VIIDQFLVKRYFADKSPLGQQTRFGGPQSPTYTIVGVVGTINSIDLGEPVAKERLYYPVTQQANAGMGLIVKTRNDPRALVSQVRAAVAAIDPEQPMAEVRTMDEWMTRSLEGAAPRLAAGAVRAVALTLSAIASRRSGVRRAQRARSWHPPGARRRPAGDPRARAGAGHADDRNRRGPGTPRRRGAHSYACRACCWRRRADPSVYAGVTAILLGVALTACYLPARRATRALLPSRFASRRSALQNWSP
jgi:putative ABC transport system permease protein